MNVLIIDDESLIREGLSNLVKEQYPRCQSVETASNGIEAEKILQSQAINLVISDIKMPGMSGLDLADKYKDDKIQFILITAYREYNYLKRAISLSVVDFIQKPIIDEELFAAMDKAYLKIIDYNLMNIYTKQMLIMDYLRGNIADYPLIKTNNADKYTLVLFQTNTNVNQLKEVYMCAVDVFRSSLCDIAQAHINIYVLILNSGFKERKTQKFIEKFYQKTAIESSLSFSEEGKVKDFPKMYQQAKVALETKLYWGLNKAISTKRHIEQNIDWNILTQLKVKLRLALEEDRYSEVQSVLAMIDRTISRWNLDVNGYRMLYFDLALIFHSYYESIGGKITMFVIPSQIQTKREVQNWFHQYVSQLMDKLDRHKPQLDEASDIVEFINNNYHHKITLEDLTEKFYLSEGTISDRIKQKTSMTFVEYLTYYRMLKSMELLESTNLTIAEIASEVGFSDSRYFSTVFKKYTGFTPTIFRENDLKSIDYDNES